MLKLNKYFFPIVSITANPDYFSADKKTLKTAEIDVTGNFGQPEEDPLGLVVMLNITVEPLEEGAIIPYDIEISAVGFFSVEHGAPAEYVEKRFPLDALGMLHSATREMIMSITSRGPWSPFILPIHVFDSEGLGSDEDEKEKPVVKKRLAASKKKSKK